MIKQLSPAIRRRLVAVRILAMTKGADAAILALRDGRVAATMPLDEVGIGLLESEIYALDLRPQDALTAFEKYVDPRLAELDRHTAAVIADNKSVLIMGGANASTEDEFYHLVDVRRILGVELRDHSAIVEASSQAAKGKHFEALPIFWQQLRSAYNMQNWRALHQAERYFAEECMGLGWLDQAAYHSMSARNSNSIDEVAKKLLEVRSNEMTSKTLDRLLDASALRAHAAQVARLLVRIADLIPDGNLQKVTEFLLNHASHVPVGWHDSDLLENTWNAIQGVAHRIECSALLTIAAKGTKHLVLQSRGPHRVHVINALNAIAVTIQSNELAEFADVALKLVGELRSDTDYTDSLNLLCRVATRSGDIVRTRILGSVFPPGAQVSDALLMRAIRHLGWDPGQSEVFSNGARVAARSIRKQVERLGSSDQPANIGGYGTFSSNSTEGRLIVHIQGAMDWVETLVTFRNYIEESALRELLEAMLEMIVERENLISNRTSLVSAIGELADRIPPNFSKCILDTLEPIAAGGFLEPSTGQTHAEATNPLNPIKLGGGNPIDLRGAALLSLAMIDAVCTISSSYIHNGILLAAITNADPIVRQYGLVAAYRSGVLSTMESTAVALASLDPDPTVAHLALGALVKSQAEVKFDSFTWHVVIRSIEAAILSADPRYRREAANLLGRAVGFPAELSERMQVAGLALRGDACYSVREAIELKSPSINA